MSWHQEKGRALLSQSDCLFWSKGEWVHYRVLFFFRFLFSNSWTVRPMWKCKCTPNSLFGVNQTSELWSAWKCEPHFASINKRNHKREHHTSSFGAIVFGYCKARKVLFFTTSTEEVTKRPEKQARHCVDSESWGEKHVALHYIAGNYICMYSFLHLEWTWVWSKNVNGTWKNVLEQQTIRF